MIIILKNLIFQEEIQCYDGERYFYAKKIAEAFIDHLECLDNEKRSRF